MGQSDGTVIGPQWVYRGRPNGPAWHVVIVAEGYTSRELGQFATDATTLANGILGAAPFSAFTNKINIARLDVASTQSGADEPNRCSGTGNNWVSTYFDATYCSSGIKRLLTVDRTLVRQTLIDQKMFFHDVIVLVNAAPYGGSGYAQVAVTSRFSFVEVALHELGHSAFDLGDEYVENQGNYSGIEPAAANLTTATNLASLKWKSLVAGGTPIPTFRGPGCGQQQGVAPAAGVIGTFEGADGYNCGLYRPAAECRMSDRAQPFCKVCQARISQKLGGF